MAVFCLVHGSTQNSSGWDLLARELEHRGHESIAVDLPANEPDASGTRYAQAIAAALDASPSPPLIVAHSVSGLFLPLVPSYAPVSRLVFLAAVIPEIGKSALQLLQENADMLCRDWIGKDPTKDDAVALEFLFHDCVPHVASWALTTRRLMFARQALSEVSPLDRWPETPSSYILCRDDRTLNAEWWRRAVPDRLGATAIELPGGHCPHVSRPGALADVLTQLV